MSQALIRKALEKRLLAMASGLAATATAMENGSFNPVAGTPYQRVNLLPATPDNSEQSGKNYFERGIFQVTLCYPSGKGSGAVEAQADRVKAAFKRGTSTTESGVRVIVMLTPKITPGYPDGDRWCIPISVTYQAQIST